VNHQHFSPVHVPRAGTAVEFPEEKRMLRNLLIVITFIGLCAVNADGQNRKKKPTPEPTPTPSEQPEELKNVKWQKGPSVGQLGTNAEIQVPAGYVFAGASDTRMIMEAYQNPTTGKEVGYVAPAGENWFAVFEFDSVGYVKDDEKASLDPDAMLESIRAGTEASNRERQRRGWPTMSVIGWEQQPRYDEATHNLEWAIKAQSEGSPVVNYNTRLLGRNGVMEVTLVTDPALLTETLPKFKTMLSGFGYTQGNRYAEFRAGDKVAEYGLTGLVVGGTAAVLVKSGAFKWLWKVLVAAGIGVAALLKKIFSRRKTDPSAIT
jgi:uncharacterized membrane-anchored protein